MHNRFWFLYGNDLEIAIEQLEKLIKLSENDRENQIKLISLLTYLGAYDKCDKWLKKCDGEKHVTGQQSRYRIHRARNERNPWRGLIDKETQSNVDELVKNYMHSKKPITVDLVGGIGDQLENAALLLASLKQLPNSDLIKMRPNGENYLVVRKLLEQVKGLQLANHDVITDSLRVSIPWFRNWLGENNLEKLPIKLLQDELPELGKKVQLLACWRCKIDANNPLSSFSRSIPFRTIQILYSKIEIIQQKKQISIIDISEYRDSEKAILLRTHPWLVLGRENIKCLDDTRNIMRACNYIASVDTSLVHLAVACGRNIQLLLNKIPDERWIDLLTNPGNYRNHIELYQQERFHNWEKPINNLLNRMRLEF